jgi:23S rRNA (pseudouridine1915-N3)-methyltransferase
MPNWVSEACDIYAKRLREFCRLSIIEVPLKKRISATHTEEVIEKEGEIVCNHIPKNAHCIVLDSQGERFNSSQLAKHIEQLKNLHSNWSLIIGGPEGHSQKVLERSNLKWSLSELTFAHPLARVMLSEVLYRSFSIIHNRPYHK